MWFHAGAEQQGTCTHCEVRAGLIPAEKFHRSPSARAFRAFGKESYINLYLVDWVAGLLACWFAGLLVCWLKSVS